MNWLKVSCGALVKREILKGLIAERYRIDYLKVHLLLWINIVNYALEIKLQEILGI